MTADRKPTFYDLLETLTAEPHYEKRDGKQFLTNIGLLQQLREAVFAGMETTGGSSAFGSKPPMDAAAEDLLNEITIQASEALSAVSNLPTPYGHAESYVRLWAGQTDADRLVGVSAKVTDHGITELEAHAAGVTRVYRETTATTSYKLLQSWVERIEGFFNPPSSAEIQAACPNCGQRYVHRQKDGQHVQSSALNFVRDRDTGETIEAKCSACKRSWGADDFERLAVLIGGKTFAQAKAEKEALEAAEDAKQEKRLKARLRRVKSETKN